MGLLSAVTVMVERGSPLNGHCPGLSIACSCRSIVPVLAVVTEGEAVLAIIASFLDENPFGVASQFTTTINWATGSPALPAVITGRRRFAVECCLERRVSSRNDDRCIR